MSRVLLIALLLSAAASAAPVMVVDSDTVQYLDGWQLDANGWLDTSVLTVDEVFYVSSSIGNDSYDGTSGTVDGGGVGPKATLNAGVALLDNGDPDWLLLKRGDDFSSQLLTSGTTGGASKTAPMLFGAYGTGARPLVKHARLTTLTTPAYIVFQDIQTVASIRPLGSKIFFENIRCGGTDTLIDESESAWANIDPKATIAANSSVIYRCIFDDHYYDGSSSKTGVYFDQNGLIISSSYFFGNSDRERREDEIAWSNNHALYINGNASNVTVDNCIAFLFATPGGLQMRPSGTMTDCLAYRAYAVGAVGSTYNWPTWNQYGVTGTSARNIGLLTGAYFENQAVSGFTAEDNIWVGSNVRIDQKTRGGAFSSNIIYGGELDVAPYNADGITPDLTFADNVFVRAASASDVRAFDFAGTASWLTVSGTVLSNGTNAYNSYYLDINGDTTADIDDFDSTFSTTATLGTPSYVDPDRGLKEYLESLGLGPYADEAAAWVAFIDIMRAQDRTTWNTAYEAEAINAYIRAGFEVSE